ncbi:unnamed protein product [Coffea canephora]|uniref:Uncharacterized protein n=1 Tax=Coffea canephora TaxID=49390 RepID=A0A068VB79_COFCA|nr:unnamed protein product [Coffea canephora]
MEISTLNYAAGGHPFQLSSTSTPPTITAKQHLLLSRNTPPPSSTLSNFFLLPVSCPFSPFSRFTYMSKLSCQKKFQRTPILASSSSSSDSTSNDNPLDQSASDAAASFFWLHLSRRFFTNFKQQTGIDFQHDAIATLAQLAAPLRRSVQLPHSALERFRSHLLPDFVNWNNWIAGRT